jgi:hypothetical protein
MGIAVEVGSRWPGSSRCCFRIWMSGSGGWRRGRRPGRWDMGVSGWSREHPGCGRARSPVAWLSWNRGPSRWGGCAGRAARPWPAARAAGAGAAGYAGRSDVAVAVDREVDAGAGSRAAPPGHRVSADTVADLLHEEGFSLQGKRQDPQRQAAPGPGRAVPLHQRSGQGPPGQRRPGGQWTPRRRNWSGHTRTAAGNGARRASR